MEFFAQMRLILKKGEGRQGLPCPEVRTLRALLPLMGPGWPPQQLLRAPHPPTQEHTRPGGPGDPHTPAPLTGPAAQQLTCPRRARGPQPWPENFEPRGGKGVGVSGVGGPTSPWE